MLFLLPDELKISGVEISLLWQFTVQNSDPKFSVGYLDFTQVTRQNIHPFVCQ